MRAIRRRIPKDLPALRAFIRRRFTREGALGLYLTVGFLACGLLVSLLTVVAHEVFEIAGPGTVDRAVTMAVFRLHSKALDLVMINVTQLGSPKFLIPASLLVSALFALQHHRVSALLFIGSVLGGLGLESLMKIAFHRHRPDLWPALIVEKTYSFPSGHATMSTLFFGACVAVVFHSTRRLRPRAVAVAAAAVIVLAVCFSRIYLGVHWLTDVCAGMLVGLFWVIVCTTGTEYLARGRQLKKGNKG
jgi:membrane-associated phospholipid phosphatase